MSKESAWEVLSNVTHFENRNLRVVTEMVRTPDRAEPRSWTVVHRKAAVIIAPMTSDGKFVLIHQERIPIRGLIWEMPGGQIDENNSNDGAIREVALRELREETGYGLSKGGELIALGDYFSSPGFTDEHGHFFLARPVELLPDGHAHDESETILDCRTFSASEIGRMIANNEIRDANTLSICARLLARGLLSFAG
jgi:ADP-ribose pyrophosphatase